MIRINVYDNPIRAKKVFESFFSLLISIRFPFPVGAIKEALNYMFTEEYGKYGVDLDLYGEDSLHKGIITENYVKVMREFQLAHATDNEDSIKQLDEDDLVFRHYYLANRIIFEASQTLYNYLYSNNVGDYIFEFPSESETTSKNDKIYIRYDNLGKLLCGYMDDDQDINEYKKCKDEIKNNADNYKKPYKQYLENVVFCFEKINGKQKEAYRFVRTIGVKACPYCNRNYVQVIEEKKGSKFHIRPALDHFRNKSDYPFLSLSMRNLVPSCAYCNGKKGKEDNVLLYPYKEGVGDAFKFIISTQKNISYFTANDCEDSYRLSIEKDNSMQIDNTLREKIENSKRLFGWDELYDEDKKYALRVFQNAYIYNKYYEECNIALLKKATQYSDKELRQILNPKLVDKKDFVEETLSKMTYDIVQQADKLENTDQKSFKDSSDRLDHYLIKNTLPKKGTEDSSKLKRK